MAHTLLNIDMIANESLAILENQLVFTKQVNREYDSEFGKKGGKIGDTYNLRLPTRVTPGTTPTFNPSNLVEVAVPVVINKQYNSGATFTSQQLALNIDMFGERVLAPHIAAIANKIDYDGMQLYKDIYQCVGTPGTTPATNLTYLQGGVKLDNAAAPNDGRRKVVINPIAQATIVNANLTLFNPAANISDQYKNGNIGQAMGYAWSMGQNVGVQTIGTFAAAASGAGTAVTVNGAISSGTSSVVTAGWTSGDLLNQGDIVTFAGVYDVNPQNRQSTGQLKQFVLTATPTAATGGGAMTIAISPTPQFSGDFQNVTSATGTIATSAVVTVYGASATVTPQNLLFHPDAFTFVTADLDMPQAGAESYTVRSKKLNMGIRVCRFFDGYNDRSNWRFDILGGWKTIRPELACRIAG